MLLLAPLSEILLLFLPSYIFSLLWLVQLPAILPASLLSQGQLPEKSEKVLTEVIAGMPAPPVAQLWVALPERLVPVQQVLVTERLAPAQPTVALGAVVVPEKLVPSLTVAEQWVAVSLAAG